ncbi:hypothetical protein [Nocardia thailandica]|uniref:ESX-1 secretion-associated protein n=1 Tax=Nocardia thailandica TaxID=257275 RepID=A0ABW6PPR1_9NOCA|nr:hypothetical protein [Nocardia thailandica]
MTTPTEMTKEFQRLAGEASAGRLIIEYDAAERCARWCDDYVTDLRRLVARTQNLVSVDSFGKLTSAIALGKKFNDLALGGAGTGSYADAATKHIEVIEAMADMYRKAGAAYQACDEQTQAAIKAKTNNLG